MGTRTLIMVVAVAALTAVAGCGGTEADRTPPPEAGGSPAPEAHPAPGAPIATEPARLAADLKKTLKALDKAIEGWTAGSGTEREPSEPVVRYALHQQRIYRVMARRPKLAKAVVKRLPDGPARQARENVAANRSLFSLTRPVKPAKARFRTADPPPAARLRKYMKRAERRFGVEWEVLAAVMHVETKFGRIKSASSAGAQGPMQFMPGTWKAYGMGGDVHDARDAVLGAANYLKASGAPRDYRRALYAYNHDRRYVDAIIRQAGVMRRDERAFYAYYNWQVYVRTTEGDLRLTGPEPGPEPG